MLEATAGRAGDSAEFDDDVAVVGVHDPLLVGFMSGCQHQPARICTDGVDVSGYDKHELTAIRVRALTPEPEGAAKILCGLSQNLVLTESS